MFDMYLLQYLYPSRAKTCEEGLARTLMMFGTVCTLRVVSQISQVSKSAECLLSSCSKTTLFPPPFKTRAEQMAKAVETSDDSLYDGTLSSSLFLICVTQKAFDAGLYGEEFEEDFAVSTGNPSGLTDAIGDDDAGADLVEPPPEDVTLTLEPPPEEEVARPIPTLDSRPRLNNNVDALPPKPTGNGSLSYTAQVAEQFSSAYRQTPSQERGRLDAARLAQFQVNQTGAGAPSSSEARPIRPSEMKDEGCVYVFPLSLPLALLAPP